jgi:hypothetical protein
MDNYTDEQKNYITFTEAIDTKLIACAGSGKTKCIIARMDNLIKNNVYTGDQILMLTFSRFTRDDFLTKIVTYKAEHIPISSIKTIDSYAKGLIDKDNEIDVSLLSYKFMKYLESSSNEELDKNVQLKMIKCLFIDEAQDLNEIQYKICMFLKEKLGVCINLIGDPNQNIYQFRNSSDKYLMEFPSKVFYLTKNFRSHLPIIEFSKYLRPFSDVDVVNTKDNSNCKPVFVFNDSESSFEFQLISFLKDAFERGIEPSKIAILSPTRGRMRGYGKSHGLCYVTNVLFKAKIKFKQFYEEATEEGNTKMRYKPEKGCVNILTYMGSKGLEWDYVFIIDADMCLINKRYFDEEKHNHDRYLLYVACSRAIHNLIIFSRCNVSTDSLMFQTNPWFSKIPKKNYLVECRYDKKFKFPQLKYNNMSDSERRVTKIIDRMNEIQLDKMAELIGYNSSFDKTVVFENKIQKQTVKIFKDYSDIETESSIFLGKYVENLFNCYLNIRYNRSHKRYVDIENIGNSSCILTNVSYIASDWYYMNRAQLTWTKYDSMKDTLDPLIVDFVEKKLDRKKNIAEYTIINDSYYQWCILKKKDRIKRIYNEYINCKDINKIHRKLFHVIVLLYSFETQHYFHVRDKGARFTNILDDFRDLFRAIKDYALTTGIEYIRTSVPVSKNGIIGEIDIIDSDNELWEIKCTSDISLKHIMQLFMYNIMYKDLKDTKNIVLRFMNFLKGEITSVTIKLTNEILESYVAEFVKVAKIE